MHQTFESQLRLPVAAEEAFAWHERPGALERLIPPWEPVTVNNRGDGIRNGSIVKLTLRLGPVKLNWIAEHLDYNAGRSFRDRQVSGPFARWEHLHDFEPYGKGNCMLTDHIDYQVPGGPLGRLLGGLIKRKLDAMFTYRHDTTQSDLATYTKHKELGTWNISVTGASGLVGATLVPMLTTGGHRVTKLVRKTAGDSEVSWDPQGHVFDASTLDGVDAIVHLAGENIAGRRWTPGGL